MDGEKIQPKDITLWQQIKYLTGTKVTTKDTDGLVYLLEFMGTILASAPLPGFENKNIPRFLTSEETYSLPNIMNYGRDPIPNVLLYGRSNVTFFMDNGGRGNPTAIAKYNINNNDLALISDQAQASSIMKNILPRGVKK